MSVMITARAGLFGALALLFTGIAAFVAPAWAEDALNAAQKTEVEALVRQYILDNPEVIVEALQTMQARQEAEAEAKQQAAIAGLVSDLQASPLSPSFGPQDADVTIIEFFDYQCGYCKRVLPDVMAVLNSDPKVRIVWKEWPILGPMSEVAARAAVAVHRMKPDAYMAFHQTIMAERGRLTEDKIFQTASGLGLDVAAVKQAMASEEVSAYLAGNNALAQRMGITGTPFFLVGDAPAPGAVSADQLRAMIAAQRAKAG